MSAVWEMDLPAFEKLVLLALADCANDEGLAWPSVATLKRKTNASERTVQRALKSLEAAKILKRDQVPGKGCKYRVTPRHSDTPVTQSPPSERRETPATVTPHPRHSDTQTVKEPSGTVNDLPNGKSKRVRNLVVSKPEGVSDKVWSSFLGLRKAKRAPVTDVVIEEIESEAAKLGWGLEAALRQMVARGWQGFEANWVKESGNGKRSTGGSTADTAQRVRERFGIAG